MDVGLPAASRVDLLRRAQDAGLIPTILPIVLRSVILLLYLVLAHGVPCPTG